MSRPDPPLNCILLETQALVEDRQNATTATALTSAGQPIQLTLGVVKPPDVSYSVCLKNKNPIIDHGNDQSPWGRGHPSVIYTSGNLALRCAAKSNSNNPLNRPSILNFRSLVKKPTLTGLLHGLLNKLPS